MRSIIRKTLLASVMAVAVAAPASAADYNWKFQSFWQATSTNQKVFEQFAANVKTMTGGRIEIEPMAVDSIVPPGEMLDAVKNNIIQGMNGSTGYFVNKDPAFGLLADLNAGYENPAQLEMWFWQGGGVELARELYGKNGVYYLGPVMWGAESIPSKMPLKSIADFKGIKMRAPEGMSATIWNKLDVGVSTLPGTEVYTALERGKIEATDWGTLGMNDELGYNKIAEYAIYPGIHSLPSGDLAISMKVWDKLPDDLKSILEMAARDLNRESLAANAVLDFEMAAKRDPKTLINWGPEQRLELREVAQTVWAEWAEKSPMAKKVYDSHIAWMKKIGLLRQ
tara:strand:+ start:196 stop:1212 length:1017 start_codon:yes stop_codon:yes gene_type:complete